MDNKKLVVSTISDVMYVDIYFDVDNLIVSNDISMETLNILIHQLENLFDYKMRTFAHAFCTNDKKVKKIQEEFKSVQRKLLELKILRDNMNLRRK